MKIKFMLLVLVSGIFFSCEKSIKTNIYNIDLEKSINNSASAC
jgi:hypothetical protein